ncbi:hypothetical protein MG293_001246 [Ovis ammon polii]|uniref:RING-type domain-containing protein n=1 Tax=Ovis ammon polii TaxID=230172 RepID=A0AAD4UMQ4_OVIAM|nr:hypothetical protein MG293_001246 [Ovis ammon polii]KAI4579577.1 hypothetical protein MJT46_000945 [Ovis ammon polii x Ovis aries]
MLGKEGRLFVLGYALAAIYEGPVANLRHNLNEVIASLGCTVELQINSTRTAWRVSTAPLRAVLKDLLSSKESLKAETQNITNSFEELDAQVNSESGFSPKDAEGSETAPDVVNGAMFSCRRWFDQKHGVCMQRIWVPLLNHLLCLPMKFKFFCSIAKAVMEVWCRSRIPVEGNFGQTYDSLNQSIHGLEGEFSATINLKEERRAGVLGLNTSWKHVSTEVRDYVRRQEAQLERTLGLLHALLSCTFLLVLHACFSYMDSYNGDIRFDNIYISTYFCQIDERRKKLGKQTLLPLRKAEKKTVIFPWDPTIQAAEMRNVAFGYRLRRVIAAFYFPKVCPQPLHPQREKKRILFLYNDLLRKRAAFTQLRRATIVRRARQQRAPRRHLVDILHRRCPLLRPWLRRRCVVCQAPETPESYLCPTPNCEAVYCHSCWNDMRQRCPVCTPREELSSSAYSDSNDDATYAE